MTAKCPHCKRTARLRFRTFDLNCRVTPEAFSYYACRACGVVFLFPVPDDLGRYYPPTYTPYAIPASPEELAATASRDDYKLEIVRRLAPSGRLLEIGPGYGGFAYLAKRAGFDVTALEMDARCCRFLREVVGVRAVQSANVPAGLAELGPFEAITLWHVLEHLPDPWAALDSIVRHVAPGGIVVIASPNPDAFQFRVLGRWWAHVDAPRHLELVPVAVLAHWMEARALRQVFLTTTDRAGRGLNRFGWVHSLMNWFTDPVGVSLMFVAGQVATTVMMPIDRSGMRGSAYTVVFQRPAE